MKKFIFFLLLLPFIGFSQAEFDEGVKITGGQPTITTPPYLTTTSIDGTQGKIPSAYIAKTATTVNINGATFDLSTNREWRTAQADTGVLTYAGATAASTTTINIGAATGYIVDNETTPGLPTYTYVNYPGASGVTVTTLGTGIATYVMLNSSGVITFQNTFPTSAERKSKIYLSKIGHPTGTIATVGDEPDFITSPLAQTRDWFQALGYINKGVSPYANGANLNINITGGSVIGNGINFKTDRTNPNTYAVTPSIVASFFRRTQTGAGGALVTLIDPANYDVSGTITAIPGSTNQATLQYIYYVPPLGYIVTYGQTIYATLTAAVAAVGKENRVIYPNLVNNSVLIGVLAVQKGATALNDTAQALFFSADMLGQIGGSTAGTPTSTMQSAYNNSAIPQVTVTDALGAMTWKSGRSSNALAITNWYNLSSSAVASVDGLGQFTGTGFIKAGGLATEALLANGTVLTGPMDLSSAQTVTGVKTFLDGKIGHRNVANTFTSFFTNANTASRTYTLPDKNGTVAMTSDLPTNTIATGTQNFLPKYNNAGGTQVGNSRLKDDGTYLGIGSVSPIAMVKDVQLGRDADKEVGIEQSNSTTAGKNLTVSAGRTINFQESANFLALNQVSRRWTAVAKHANGNVYATEWSGSALTYIQTGGTGNFSTTVSGVSTATGIACHPNGDVYQVGGYSNQPFDIYKQTAGSGNFSPIGQTPRVYYGVAVHQNNNIYVTVDGGDIYMQTNSTGTFNALGQTARQWRHIAVHPISGDVYATVYGGDIYKQTAGSGNFVALGQTSRNWLGISCAPNGDVYASVTGGDIYKQTGGTGAFIALGQTSRSWSGLCVTSTGDVYASGGTYNTSDDLYFLNNQSTGTADLNGGTLKLKAGTGKGTGQSRVQIIAGTKTSTGTTMQSEQVVAEFDENGKTTFNGAIKLKGYTVATLPSGTVGDVAYVTDATAPTYLTTVTGGGAVVTPVFYNGTNWVAH